MIPAIWHRRAARFSPAVIPCIFEFIGQEPVAWVGSSSWSSRKMLIVCVIPIALAQRLFEPFAVSLARIDPGPGTATATGT